MDVNSWIAPMRELCLQFQNSENRLKLLREIDKKIVEKNFDLLKLLQFVSKQLVSLSNGSKAHVFSVNINNLDSVYSTEEDSNITLIPLDEKGQLLRKAFQEKGKVIDNDWIPQSILKMFSGNSIVAIEIRHSTNDLFGVIILESHAPSTVKFFSGGEILNFLRSVSAQLTVATQSFIKNCYNSTLYKIFSSFFLQNLKPTTCLNSIILNLPDLFPDFPSYEFPQNTGVQLLFHEEESNYLTIEATTGIESLGTRVSIEDSFCGKLIDNPEKNHFVEDVKKSKRFKNYLGRIGTELALSVKHDSKILAIINLENENKYAFKNLHISLLKKFCQDLGPVISGFKYRIDRTGSQRSAVLYQLDDYLDSICNIYSHAFKTPKSGAETWLGLLKDYIPRNKKIQEAVSELEICVNDYTKIQKNLTSDIVGFSRMGGFELKDLILESTKIFIDDKYLISKKGPKIQFGKLIEDKVYCSVFLKQHIHNIIRNSQHAINDKIAQGKIRENEGIIKIWTEKIISDKKSPKLNEKIRIIFLDNGTGVDDSIKSKVLLPKFTTKNSGSGLGLFSAHEYICGIGGNMQIESKEGEYFKVIIQLDKYNKEIH